MHGEVQATKTPGMHEAFNVKIALARPMWRMHPNVRAVHRPSERKIGVKAISLRLI